MAKLTLQHVLHRIRDRIEHAAADDDRQLLRRIATATTILVETVPKSENKHAWLIMLQLRQAARQGSMGFSAKECLPSHQKITEAFG